jgi:hypothetical protein
LTETPEHTQANGFAHGRPEGREARPLDSVVEEAIASLPAATRLYPEIYSWMIVDAVTAALKAEEL